jgi:hypothetical protein
MAANNTPPVRQIIGSFMLRLLFPWNKMGSSAGAGIFLYSIKPNSVQAFQISSEKVSGCLKQESIICFLIQTKALEVPSKKDLNISPGIIY